MKYDFIIRTVYTADGYYKEQQPLPRWMHITIETEDSTKWVTVHSRIHERKAVRLNPCYSTTISDLEILEDISDRVRQKYL